MQENFSFNGGGGSYRTGFLDLKKAYSSSYESSVFFDAPEIEYRRSLQVTYNFDRPKLRGYLFQSVTQLSIDENPVFFHADDIGKPRPPADPKTIIHPSELPQLNSQQVMLEYRKLAEAILEK